MTDLSQFTLACLPELILAIGALTLLMLGAFVGERATAAVLAGGVLVIAGVLVIGDSATGGKPDERERGVSAETPSSARNLGVGG